jgi:hypothetical protein
MWQPFWKWRLVEIFQCRIDSWHWKISSGCHFQNGRHNTAQIQHCSISTTFHMWVDNDVPNLFQTLKNFPHIKFWWYRTMLNFCGIVVAILKMVIGRNFSMSGINSGHHYLPTYEMSLKSNKFLTSKTFYQSPFSKWPPQYRANSTLFDFNEISYVGRLSGGRHMLSVMCINRFITWSHDVPLNDYIELAFPGDLLIF